MMQIYLLDWVSVSLKLFHIVVGIAWIGTSFYFNWLDSRPRLSGLQCHVHLPVDIRVEKPPAANHYQYFPGRWLHSYQSAIGHVAILERQHLLPHPEKVK
jgi:hypothetical protein